MSASNPNLGVQELKRLGEKLKTLEADTDVNQEIRIAVAEEIGIALGNLVKTRGQARNHWTLREVAEALRLEREIERSRKGIRLNL